MASVILNGDTSGSVTISPPAVAGTQTVTLPAASGVLQVSGNMPAFSAYSAGNQTITNATWTKVTIDTETFDTNNNFASSRFTPTVAGYYQVNGLLAVSATLATIFIVGIFKNGAEYARGNDFRGAAGFFSSSNLVTSQLIYLNGTTDYIEMYANIYASSAQTVLGGGMAGGTYFQAALVRSA